MSLLQRILHSIFSLPRAPLAARSGMSRAALYKRLNGRMQYADIQVLFVNPEAEYNALCNAMRKKITVIDPKGIGGNLPGQYSARKTCCFQAVQRLRESIVNRDNLSHSQGDTP